MRAARAFELGIAVLVVWGRLTFCASGSKDVRFSVCPVVTVADSILGSQDKSCVLDAVADLVNFIAVNEGDEASLQRALNMVHEHRHEYIAVLFYASWCPFSKSFRPNFSILSSLYPSIPHFAIEESAVRPSILSKYGVHGFPTFFLLNSTMRIHYLGSRSLVSLISFYSDITGIETQSVDNLSLDKIGLTSKRERRDNIDPESCPFFWARSPGNMLQQETYLALATGFVILRLLYRVSPNIWLFIQLVWRRRIQFVRLTSLLEHSLAYLNRAKEPSKRRNFQGGAMNARAWASKSLATVSIGDTSSSRRSGVVGE